LVDRRPPCAAAHDDESQAHGGNDRAREEQSLDTVLDRVENDEGEDEPEEEQEQRTQQRMPKPRVE